MYILFLLRYSSHPEFFVDEIAELQKQIDERRAKRRRRHEEAQPKFYQDPKLIDMTKYFTIALVLVYFAFKRRRLLSGEKYLDPEDDIRNERIMKLQVSDEKLYSTIDLFQFSYKITSTHC